MRIINLINNNYNDENFYSFVGIFKSTCQVDIVMFPFDNQNCRLKFGTWTYNERLVNLTLPDGASFGWAGNSSYQENAEWVLISAFGTRNTIEYDGIGVFIDVTYEINIQRKTVYYFNNLIAPCIVIASMVIFGFQTPPDSGEKLTLCITILMSLTFFMNMVLKRLMTHNRRMVVYDSGVSHDAPHQWHSLDRDLLLLDHGDGRLQRGLHRPHPQLPQEDSGQPLHALLGGDHLPPLASLAPQDGASQQSH